MTRRLCIFAHYDAQGEIKPFVVYYLRKLREVCGDLVFVSVSNPSSTELRKLDGIASSCLFRENVGYDFAMWRLGVSQTDLAGYDELLLTNSSVFGPLWPLESVFERMAGVPCDIWGMTDNGEIAWHLQSYFLVFRRQIIESEAFRSFWASVLPYQNKTQVIRSYEIGLSIFFKEQGFHLVSLVKVDDLYRSSSRIRLWKPGSRKNPTCSKGLALIDAGMPLVKVELFRDNPLGVDLRPVRHAIERTGYDLDLLVYDRPRHAKAVQNDSA